MYEFLRQALSLLRQAALPALAALAVGTAALALWWRRRRRHGQPFPWRRAAALVLLLGELAALAAITLLTRLDGPSLGVQPYPFLAFWEAWNAFTLKTWLNPLLNVAMFLPLGVLLPLAAPPFRRWYLTLAAGAGLSLGIELLQLWLGRGQADVDDLMCNTLGTMLGYCLCALGRHLRDRRWRRAAGCALLPALCAAALAGVFLVYALRPYGNLADAPIYPARAGSVRWEAACSLSDRSGQAGVYWAAPYTRSDCDAFATAFLARQGTPLDRAEADVIYYDDFAFYSDHATYALTVYYHDRSYSYHDYRVDLSAAGEASATEETLRAALAARGIDLPGEAAFDPVDRERGIYAFRANSLAEDGALVNGELTCHLAEGGALRQVDSTLLSCPAVADAPVISQREAYLRLRAGRFSWRDVPSFNAMAPRSERVLACELGYLTDSKGYRQPVYFFTLSDEYDQSARGGQGWTTFVPALAG